MSEGQMRIPRSAFVVGFWKIRSKSERSRSAIRSRTQIHYASGQDRHTSKGSCISLNLSKTAPRRADANAAPWSGAWERASTASAAAAAAPAAATSPAAAHRLPPVLHLQSNAVTHCRESQLPISKRVIPPCCRQPFFSVFVVKSASGVLAAACLAPVSTSGAVSCIDNVIFAQTAPVAVVCKRGPRPARAEPRPSHLPRPALACAGTPPWQRRFCPLCRLWQSRPSRAAAAAHLTAPAPPRAPRLPAVSE